MLFHSDPNFYLSVMLLHSNPKFYGRSWGNSGVERVQSLRHPLQALPARGEQADEAGGKESEGVG